MNGPDADGQVDRNRSSLRSLCRPLNQEQECRLHALLGEFLERLQSRDDPDPCEMILAHPDIASELERRLTAAEELYHLGQSLATADIGLTHPQNGFPANGIPAKSPAHFDLEANSEATVDPTRSPFGRLGRYELREVLGRGTSSVVYRALDTKFEREVALKVFRFESFGTSDTAGRFERDARIAAQLRHPNIVPLHDANELEGFRCIDMELIRGGTLAKRFDGSKGQPCEPSEAARLIQKIAEALEYTHRNGIIHRDVKPSNILLDERGEPQLTDFGLARNLAGVATLTLDGQILGTPAYMSPEQAEGRSHEADGRSDVYSLGVVLYRMLTGKLPFEGADTLTTLLTKIADHEPPRPRSLNCAIPGDLEMICMKAMEKRPADRFQTAVAFADELRRWVSHELLTIRPPTWWEKLRRWARRNRLTTRATVMSATLLLVVSFSLGTTAWRQASRAHEAQLRQAIEARHRATTQVRVLIEQACQRLRTPTQGRRWETEATLRKAAEPLSRIPGGAEREQLLLDLRSAFAATLAIPDLSSGPGDRVELPVAFYQVWPVALHPDGGSMVIGTPQGPVRWVRGQTRPGRPGGEHGCCLRGSR
jgi:tRNA A-37 threonylcarbamoyl transferase component Bud32